MNSTMCLALEKRGPKAFLSDSLATKSTRRAQANKDHSDDLISNSLKFNH
jgi:hypothetical protein